MSIAIVNSYFFSLSIDNQLVYYSSVAVGENLCNILEKYLPPLTEIKEVYLCSGPGSLVASRSLISYFLGMNIYKDFKIFYIDCLRDLILCSNKKYGLYSITPKKFILGQIVNNKYEYQFMDLSEFLDKVREIKTETVILDQSVLNISKEDYILLSKLNFKVFYWNSNDIFLEKNTEDTMNSIVNYSLW